MGIRHNKGQLCQLIAHIVTHHQQTSQNHRVTHGDNLFNNQPAATCVGSNLQNPRGARCPDQAAQQLHRQWAAEHLRQPQATLRLLRHGFQQRTQRGRMSYTCRGPSQAVPWMSTYLKLQVPVINGAGCPLPYLCFGEE